ncbi:MAG: YCF48-related protein [Ignavibacteria bacterium]
MKIYRTILADVFFFLSFSTYSFTQVIYSNSFETPQDTVGLQRYGSIMFSNDVPSEGGTQSLYISGGCLWPHTLIEIGPFNNNGFYIIRCWGKDLQIGGGVSLNVEGNRTLGGINIGVNEKNWTFYESAETLFCSAGKKLELSMGAGGIAPSAMLIDNIEVINVKSEETGWIIRNSSTIENLSDVAMLDSITAVIVGNEGSILKTTDAGETWRSTAPVINCPRPINCILKLNKIVFYDSLNGMAAGQGTILLTSDGGEEWQFLNAPSGNNFLSISNTPLFNIFVGDDSGYIYNSLDTGKTWTSEKVADLPILSIYPVKYNPIILGIYIFEVYALTSNSLYIKSGTDPWKDWGQLGFFQGLGSGAFEGEFSENGTQFIVGVQGDFIPQSTIIRLRPQDSHWYSVGPQNEIGELRGLSIPKLFEVYLSSRVIPFPSIIYTCGSGGKILKSTNDGNYWISLNTPTSQTLNSIYFFTKNHGFAVGDSGTILYTSTGGVSSANNPPNPFSLISPPNEDIRPVPRSIGFMWSKADDPDGDLVKYTVLISGDSCASWNSYGPTEDTLLQVHSPAQVPGRYYWMVVANDGMLAVSCSEIFVFTIYSLADAEENEDNIPDEFALHQNYPNPFNPSTRIKYELPGESEVQLIIYNALGEKAAELVDEFQKAGRYEVEWNGSGFTSGIYFCSIKAGNFSKVQKLVLIK